MDSRIYLHCLRPSDAEPCFRSDDHRLFGKLSVAVGEGCDYRDAAHPLKMCYVHDDILGLFPNGRVSNGYQIDHPATSHQQVALIDR